MPEPRRSRKPVADWAEGKHSLLLIPQGNPTSTQQLPPASPVGTASSWRGRICPRAGAAWPELCTSVVCPLCHNYTGLNSPQAAMLSGFPRKSGRVPCFQGQLNSPRNHPQLPPRPSFLCCWRLGWTGRPPDFALLWCCRSQRVSG